MAIITLYFSQVAKNIGETYNRTNESIQKKIKDTREYWKKKREET